MPEPGSFLYCTVNHFLHWLIPPFNNASCFRISRCIKLSTASHHIWKFLVKCIVKFVPWSPAFLLFAQIHNTRVISMLCPRSRFYPSYLNQFHALKRDIVPRNTFCCKIYRFKLADSRLTRLTSVINLCAFQSGKKTTLGLFTSVTGTP